MENTVIEMGSIEQIDIGALDLGKAEFYLADSGFTGLKYNGEDYSHVTLKRALPIGLPMEYISVADSENKEIGIIKSVDDLSGEQYGIVLDELNRRYYCPEVLDIKSVKDKLGYVYMELVISVADSDTTFVKNCAVKDVNKNIRMLSDDSLIIYDVDGNRYMIKSLCALGKNGLKKLESYIF
ncbi:MAG: DUF1854 domain-containing protein [Oscillospiraceae bacterium]|nr:DUF1854 domain-containing protein [Oscillospiraceae bacterium]